MPCEWCALAKGLACAQFREIHTLIALMFLACKVRFIPAVSVQPVQGIAALATPCVQPQLMPHFADGRARGQVLQDCCAGKPVACSDLLDLQCVTTVSTANAKVSLALLTDAWHAQNICRKYQSDSALCFV